MSALKVASVLVLLLLVVRADDGIGNDGLLPSEEKVVVPLSFNITHASDWYKALMSEMDRQLARTTTKPHILRRPVLGQYKHTPDNWIHVTLKGQGTGQCTLAVRADNLYLVGFKTTSGSWFVFRGKDNLIHGSTPLSFADDYASLTGAGGYKNLKSIVVGKKSAQQALDTLANYKKDSTPEKEVKQALVRFVLIFCEAARFQVIRADVASACDHEEGGTVSTVGVELTVLWRDISCALLASGKTKWGSTSETQKIKKYGKPEMESAEAAAANVYCILDVVGC